MEWQLALKEQPFRGGESFANDTTHTHTHSPPTTAGLFGVFTALVRTTVLQCYTFSTGPSAEKRRRRRRRRRRRKSGRKFEFPRPQAPKKKKKKKKQKKKK